MTRIPTATQSEAPQLVDIEQARKLEEVAEAAAEAAAAEADEVAAAEAEEEQTTNEFQETANEVLDGDGDDDDDDDDTTWDGDDGDDATFACSFDYEDDSSSADNLQWWDGDDEDDDDFEDLDQVIESNYPTEVNNQTEQQQQHLVEIQSPTFYFYGQMPDPSGEKSTFGKYVDRDGTIYDGQWKNNHYHGYGSLFDPVENSFFVGQFENSQMEGQGWMSYSDGIVISGTFSASAEIVQGTIRYPSGDMYVGDIKGKLMHGRGFLYYNRGDWIALISNDFEEGSLNGAEGIIIEADGLTLHHATFISGIEENTIEIDETIGMYTMEELGLGYEDILAFALLGTNMTDPLLLRTFDYLYHGNLGDDVATPNWRDWDMADWFVVTSAFCLVIPLLRPVVLRRVIRFLAFDILKPILRALFHSFSYGVSIQVQII